MPEPRSLSLSELEPRLEQAFDYIRRHAAIRDVLISGGDPLFMSEDKLDWMLSRLRAMKLPSNPEVGPCTLNIGLIEGGRAPNVIPDYAHADLLYRLVGSTEELRKQIVATAGDQVEVTFPLELAFLRLRTVDGLPTMIAAFTTDIPKLTKWGKPLLIGPGSIHVAHTDGEHIEKRQLHEAIDLYCAIAKKLQI